MLHLDETTPHIHAHLVPIHREKGWLSWEDWFGGKEKIRNWQDKFAQYFEPLGLRRGLSRSVAVHAKIQDFYARINEDLQLPDFERELTLPPPLPEETTENYYQRLVSHFSERLPPLHDALETIAAHAKNEEWEKTQASNTRIMLHAMQDEVESLEFQVRQYSQDLHATQLELSAYDTQQREAIAQEMLAIAQLVLNTAQKNYLRGARYTFSRRRGFTKIDSREGQRRVHDEGGKPTLTENFTPADLIYLRQQRQQLIQKSEAIVLQQQQRAKSGV